MQLIRLAHHLPEGWQAFQRLEPPIEADTIELRMQTPPGQTSEHVANVCQAFVVQLGERVGRLHVRSLHLQRICPTWWRIQIKGRLDPRHYRLVWN